MATAHRLHGYLGAGRTTFARRLEEELPAIRFSHDEWMTSLYGDDPPMDQFAAFHQRVSDLVDKNWTRCLKLGLDGVLDFGFWSRRQRDETRATVLALGARTRLYHLEYSEDEAWRRVDKRNAHLDGSLFIVRNTFEMLKSRFEPLADDEDRTEIGQC